VTYFVPSGGSSIPLPLDHTNLADIINTGVNTHAQIDTALGVLAAHVVDFANPHMVTAAQVGAQPVDAVLTALSGYSSTGILTLIAPATFASRTITAGSGAVTVTDGDGVAGDPTIDLSATGVAAGSYRSPNITVDAKGRVSVAASTVDAMVCEGRLTLTTGVPVTTSDVTGATTIYFTPYKGNRVALYDGSAFWDVLAFSELSIAVPAVASTVYDVFVYNNAGTPTLELTAWSSDTARATALTTQDGVYVKTGATTRRYLGTFRTTGVAGQVEDSTAFRYLWNYYNRVQRSMNVLATVINWTYTTATWRQANASSVNQLDFVIGVSEDAVKANVRSSAGNTNTGVTLNVGVGLDSTTAVSALCTFDRMDTAVANFRFPLEASWIGWPGIGRHFLAWLEQSVATGTTTWLGSTAVVQSGISGDLWC
jgi:hypothetical protein